jgi:hypothetical protein
MFNDEINKSRDKAHHICTYMEKVFHLEINDIGNRKEEENKRNEKKVA